MTKDQIKALVSSGIAGQGNQIDISGKITTIFNEILNLIPDPVREFIPLTAWETEIIEPDEALEKYGLDSNTLHKLENGEIDWIGVGEDCARVTYRGEGRIECSTVDALTEGAVSGATILTIEVSDDGNYDIKYTTL